MKCNIFPLWNTSFLIDYGKFVWSIVSSFWEISMIWLANIICGEITKLFLSRLLVCVGLFWGVALSCFFVQDCHDYLGVFRHWICTLSTFDCGQKVACLAKKFKLLQSLDLLYFKDVEVIFGSLQDQVKILERHRWVQSSSGIHFSVLFFSEFLKGTSFWLMDLSSGFLTG